MSGVYLVNHMAQTWVEHFTLQLIQKQIGIEQKLTTFKSILEKDGCWSCAKYDE